MDIRAVIFDLDGTLVDTENLHLRAWNMAVGHHGDDGGMAEEEYGDYAGGGGLRNAALIASRRPHIDVEPHDLLSTKDGFFKENIDDGVTLMESAHEVLKKCQELGLEIAIATASPRNEAEAKMRPTDLHQYFEHVITADDVENIKPHPEAYMNAYTALGVDPKHCVAVEDTQHGLESAKAAGLYCIVKPTKTTSKQSFEQADYVAENLADAMAHIESLINS